MEEHSALTEKSVTMELFGCLSCHGLDPIKLAYE